jgi:hypothetical protein
MLSGIVADAVDKSGLSLGRETKSVLRELKAIGDRSAHNIRLVVDELIQLAELRR